jgi:hypothetical protein
MDTLFSTTAVVGGLLVSSLSQAALVAVNLDANPLNGHEVVFDTSLNISWLADANIAASNHFGVSGINANGSMNWNTAQNFIAAMNSYNSGTGYLGINNWRQSLVAPIDGSLFSTSTITYDGSSDRGYQISAAIDPVFNPSGQSAGFTGSEMAYHYYNNLAAIGACSGNGTTLGNCVSSTVYGVDDANNSANLSLFNNLQNSVYWTGSELSASGSTAFRFANMLGLQDTAAKTANYYVMPVADLSFGNYSDPIEQPVVPLPATAWLFASALTALAIIPRHQRRSNY